MEKTQMNDRVKYNSFNKDTVNLIEPTPINDTQTNQQKTNVDLSEFFINFYGKWHKGISSSCAIASIMSYYLKLRHNISNKFSPHFLAYNQFVNTQSWENIDLYTGLNITKYTGICSNRLVPRSIDMNIINNHSVITDAENFKIRSLRKFIISCDELINALSMKDPILTSIKIIPYFNKHISNNEDCFYEYFDNDDYWTVVSDYYKYDNPVYAVSVIIVGYDKEKQQFKVRDSYNKTEYPITISFSTIVEHSELFFDTYTIEPYFPLLENYAKQDRLMSAELQHNDESSPIKKLSKVGSQNDMFSSYMSVSSMDDLCLADTSVNVNVHRRNSLTSTSN